MASANNIERFRDARGWKRPELARRMGTSPQQVERLEKGQRHLKQEWIDRAAEALGVTPAEIITPLPDGVPRGKLPELPVADPQQDYDPVEVLPTYGGAGGGGTGDSDPEVALVPRALIRDVLRGKPSDFIVINVRGDSMEPDFRHGDQLLIDKRDNSPAQPGPFALWDGEWGEYVVKNVERSHAGEVRVFSSNQKYSAAVIESEQTRIIGRPVWFGRRL